MAAFSPNLIASSPHKNFSNNNQLCCLGLRPEWKQKKINFLVASKGKGPVMWIVRSVLDNQKSSIDGNGATEPTRILLERLFAQTQKLEERIGRDPRLPEDAELGLSLEKLESDLQAALAALKKKEEDLQHVEMNVLLEYNELNRAKEELERREEEITAATTRQERLEEELRKANLVLASQVMVIEELKLCLRERDRETFAAQSALSLKEDEINKMSNDLMRKSEEVANAESELRSKEQLLNEANEIVRRQEVEIHELRRSIQEKEEELEFIMSLQKTEQDKLRVMEANLKKQTTDWLVAQEELKKLEEEMSKYTGEANETLEDFRRVRKLLTDVKAELVSSQKAFALSRQRIEEQEQLLEQQLEELDAQRKSVMSYITCLKDATVEVESERIKLRLTEARNKELERELAMEKALIVELQKELDKERSSLEQALQDEVSLKEELNHRTTEFEGTENLLHIKESELVEARLEIQHLKSEQASLQSLLEKKDLELLDAQKMLAVVNQEIAELKILMKNREDQLTQATSALKEKEENVQTIKHELDSTKQKFSEAESVVEKIVELTNDLALSARGEQFDRLSLLKEADDKLSTYRFEQSAENFNWQKKQLETELQFTRESLKTKEMEVLAAQRALTIKDEELKLVSRKLDNKETELIKMKEEMNQDIAELRQLYALAQERIGEKSIGDLAIEKLQLEAAELEVEAATCALQKLTEMSRDLLNKASLSIDADFDVSIMPHNNTDDMANIDESGCLAEVKTEVAKLSALTEQFVKEAGLVGDTN
ncbi:hypothetical protein ACH5RR_040079 [Cinchona calisaya]|uniref:Uncharacterized protein n=1 Tax=Cinchona calisaya TaxID=153742 RepID=A0ABD2XT55_9GENT